LYNVHATAELLRQDRLKDSLRETAIRFDRELRIERAAFAAKVRLARAVLAMSQEEFAGQVGLTQKSIHRIEQGAVEPKLRTMLTIERFWSDRGISFEDAPNGGFSLTVDSPPIAGE
jgi:DNA-binding XRE family transcriptional regulator